MKPWCEYQKWRPHQTSLTGLMMISWDHVSQYDEWPSQWSYFYGFKCWVLTARWWRDRDVVLVHIGAGPEVTNSSAGHNRAGLRLAVVTLGLNGAGAGHLYTSTPGGHQLSSLLITPASAWDSGSCMSSSDSVVSRLPVIACD